MKEVTKVLRALQELAGKLDAPRKGLTAASMLDLSECSDIAVGIYDEVFNFKIELEIQGKGDDMTDIQSRVYMSMITELNNIVDEVIERPLRTVC